MPKLLLRYTDYSYIDISSLYYIFYFFSKLYSDAILKKLLYPIYPSICTAAVAYILNFFSLKLRVYQAYY